MTFVRRRSWLVVGLAAAVGGVVLLTGCSPANPTAVRLNKDGSLDFVSCIPVKAAGVSTATTTLRNGPNGQVNDTTANTVTLTPPIDHLDAGDVIEFSGLPQKWDRVDVTVNTASGSLGTFGIGERDQLTVGQWFWEDQSSMLPDLNPRRCDIKG